MEVPQKPPLTSHLIQQVRVETPRGVSQDMNLLSKPFLRSDVGMFHMDS